MQKRNVSIEGAIKESAKDLKRADVIQKGEAQQSVGGGSRSFSEDNVSVTVAHSPSYKNMIKEASTGSLDQRANSGRGGTSRIVPEIYSPLYQFANLNLPRDRPTMNAWNRAFYQTNPYVKNAISLHATYPISKLNIKCKDQRVERFFNDMAEDMNLFESLFDIALEYWVNGEAFPFAEFDEERGVFSKVVIYNPDYMVVKRAIVSSDPVIYMKPDARLQQIATSTNPLDANLRKSIPDYLLNAVRKGAPIPIDNFNISHLKMLSHPYDLRGMSIIVSVYKDLMLFDKLRESKFAQADSMINPITVVKIGGNAEGEYRPTPQDLEYWRTVFEEAQYDKDFKIFTHQGVDIQRVGYSGHVIDIQADLEFIIKNIIIGLMIPPSLLDQEWASYGSASIGLEVLRDRYISFRNVIKRWLERKIFAPISKVQGFYEYKDGKKKLIIPEIEWNKMNLYDLDNFINFLTQLNQAPTPKVSLHSLFRSLDLNYDDEMQKIREEQIDQIRLTKEIQIIQGKSLSEIRSIDKEKPLLEESDQTMLPGQIAAPGAEMGAPMMGGDLGMGGGMMGGEMGGLGGELGLGEMGGAPAPGGMPGGEGGEGGGAPPV